MARDTQLIVIDVSAQPDPGGARLRAVLDGHTVVERRRLLGRFLLYSTIVFSVPLWLAVAWPALVPVGLGHLAMVFATACALGGLLVRS